MRVTYGNQECDVVALGALWMLQDGRAVEPLECEVTDLGFLGFALLQGLRTFATSRLYTQYAVAIQNGSLSEESLADALMLAAKDDEEALGRLLCNSAVESSQSLQ